ncbi:MAG: DUF2334 domain-containing protein [Solirubrobacterales bacterium]|nr:DUF2334 domain-containing protein [Solirubrobacterales bacterium]
MARTANPPAADVCLPEPEPARPLSGPAVTVTIHDVEPRSFLRVTEIRRWLSERNIDRVTFAVIPAADLHPIGRRSPLLAGWLRAQVARGDSVAQHGLQHRTAGSVKWPRGIVAGLHGARAAEFPGLDHEETEARVRTGLALLREVELDPRGFIAPGYAYTPALRGVLEERFSWFGDVRGVTLSGESLRSPALRLGTSTTLKRVLSPPLLSARAHGTRGTLLRLDIHPRDFELPRHLAAVEQALCAAQERHVVTYDELSAAPVS